MYIENIYRYTLSRHPILSTSHTARLLGFNVYLRHSVLTIARSFAASRRAWFQRDLSLKILWFSWKRTVRPVRNARTHVRILRKELERNDSRIKRRSCIPYQDIIVYHPRRSVHEDCAAVPSNLRPSSEKRAWNPVEPPRWLLIVIINGIMT